MESNCNLCNDLLRDILLRLPIKSLLRYQSVSKPWRSLIADPSLLRNSPKLIIFESKSCFSSDPNNLEKLHLPAELDRHSDLVPEGSCNGLILLRASNDSHLWIWNVLSRVCYSIEIPDLQSKNPQNASNYGFVYDSVHDDYKVIRIFSFENDLHKLINGVLLYSLRHNSWKRSKDLDSYYTISNKDTTNDIKNPSGLLLNGKLHWNTTRNCIIAFDVSTEEFLEIAALPVSDNTDTSFGVLGELGGCFTVTEFSNSFGAVAIWMLKESGWDRLLRISGDKGFLYMAPLAYSKTGNHVLVHLHYSCVWWNIKKGKIDKFFYRSPGRGVYTVFCSETLVSMSAYRSHEEDQGKGEEN